MKIVAIITLSLAALTLGAPSPARRYRPKNRKQPASQTPEQFLNKISALFEKHSPATEKELKKLGQDITAAVLQEDDIDSGVDASLEAILDFSDNYNMRKEIEGLIKDQNPEELKKEMEQVQNLVKAQADELEGDWESLVKGKKIKDFVKCMDLQDQNMRQLCVKAINFAVKNGLVNREADVQKTIESSLAALWNFANKEFDIEEKMNEISDFALKN